MSSRTPLRVLDDCLAFDADMYRLAQLNTEKMTNEDRCASRDIQASLEVLRLSLQSCLIGNREYSPALAHRHARQRLRSEEMITTAESVLQATAYQPHAKRLKPKRIIRMSRELLDQAIPLIDLVAYEPSDELPDRCVPAALLVDELLHEIYLEARQPDSHPDVTGAIVLHEIGTSGVERAHRIVEKQFGENGYFLSASALSSAALLTSRRIFAQKKHGNLTMDTALPLLRQQKDWRLDA